MSDFEAENRELRQQLKGLDECMYAFVEASEGVIAELEAFCDACSADPALHERARAAASAAGERMHLVIDTVGRRFATYRALNPVPPGAEGPDFTAAQGE